MNGETGIRALAALRLAIGAGAFGAPGLAGRLFGLDVPGNPQAPYLARLFGARDVGLAVGTLASAGDARRTWLAVGIACDAADFLAALLAGRDGSLSRVSATLCAAPALAAVGLGAVALQGSGDEPAPAAA